MQKIKAGQAIGIQGFYITVEYLDEKIVELGAFFMVMLFGAVTLLGWIADCMQD